MMLLMVHLVCCAILVGLIWTIQLLHYPAFSFVRESHFLEFHQQHSQRITFLVGPLMVAELASAVGLVWLNFENALLWVNLSGVLLIWGCTFFISVPIHNSLAERFDVLQIRKLVLTNWFRTTLWSARLILLIFVALSLNLQQ